MSPTDPATLGAAARSGEWLLTVSGLDAAWYDDVRPHPLTDASLSLSNRAALLLVEGIAPLVPAITQDYRLWNPAGSPHRLPWRTRYDKPFWLVYRCDVVDGERLDVGGNADVAFDRPVTTVGKPLSTPTGGAVVSLKRSAGVTRLIVAAVVTGQSTQVFALANALVRATTPRTVLVEGDLTGGSDVRSGVAHLALGVMGWLPTLPDPYVANVAGSFRRHDRVVSQLVARVKWADPAAPVLAFEGELTQGLAASRLAVSDGVPVPARTSGSPLGSQTQVEQHAVVPDRLAARERAAAQRRTDDELAAASGRARERNEQGLERVSGVLKEFGGSAPGVLLLDVSTNQDLLGVGLAARPIDVRVTTTPTGFPVEGLTVHASLENVRIVALPQVQWEPVRTLDTDQDIATLGWFPTPLASGDDGGATQIAVRSQKLTPVVPEPALATTVEEFRGGAHVAIRTTFPFGMVAGVHVSPFEAPDRRADVLELMQPVFIQEAARGGLQLTARAEGGRRDDGGVSPSFAGVMFQLRNGVDLATGLPLGISVLGATADPNSDVEDVFNNDMLANPRVPVTRFDISGYGGSSFSDWQNPFAAFAEAAKVQFRYAVGRTSLEIVKVNSVLHPWGIRVTRSVTIERRPGGGVIRRDTGWQPLTPGLFDYRYFDKTTQSITVAPYEFDAGVFRGLFSVRSIRPAPGAPFSSGGATLVPYYFDADAALEDVPGRSAARGVLGFLQVTPNGQPAPAAALQSLIAQQGPIGGPIDIWTTIGESGLPFRAQRVEVGLADDGGTPLFVATVRGAAKLPSTGAWSVVRRPLSGGVPGAAETVADDRGVPLVRRYPVKYPAASTTVYSEPPLVGTAGDHRLADAADLLVPSSPAHEYALLQSTPTHAVIFPRPVAPTGTPGRLILDSPVAVSDVIARSTSKAAFPPPQAAIALPPGGVHLDVGPTGSLALSSPIDIVAHPTSLQLAGGAGHGSKIRYDSSTIHVELQHHRWAAEINGLRLWTDIAGITDLTGNELRIVGATEQRPQVAEIRSLVLSDIEDVLQFIPLFGAREKGGPIDLGASNAKHELNFEVATILKFPKKKIEISAADPEASLTLALKAKSGFDTKTGGAKASGGLGAELEGRFPVATVGVASIFIIVSLEVGFTLTSVAGTVKSEEFELVAFAGVGVKGKIGPFMAYAFLGIGFVLEYDAVEDKTKYGGLVALEAGVDLKVVEVKIRAELKGLVYDDAGTTKCDYSGSVEINVEIFVVISISASYQVSETKEL